MSQTNSPEGNANLSSELSIKDTVKKHPRQGGILAKAARFVAAGGLAWLSAQSIQPDQNHSEASAPSEIARLLGHTLDTVPGYLGPDLSFSSSIRILQQGNTITRTHPMSGQELRWSILYQYPYKQGEEIEPNPIVFQYLFDDYPSAEEKIASGKEVATDFINSPVIRDFKKKFLILGRIDTNYAEKLLCGSNNTGNPYEADCVKEPYKKIIQQGNEAGISATENGVIRKWPAITGWADITRDFNIIPPTNDFTGLLWKINDTSTTKWRYPLHEVMHNWGWEHPPKDSPEDKTSIMGHGMEILPQDEVRLRAILRSNQDNPNARYVFPAPQSFSIRETNTRLNTSSVNKIQGLGELDTGLLTISPEGVKQIFIRRVPALGDGAMLEYYFGSQDVIHALSEIGLRNPEPYRGSSNQNTLGGQSYEWQVRVSPLQTSLLNSNAPDKGWSDPRWNEFEIWPGKKITIPTQTLTERLPAPSSASISPVTLRINEISSSVTPLLKWNDSKTNQFYYEVQLTTKENIGSDGEFISDPNKALGPLYWELIHGGETNNSYQVKPEFALEPGKTYLWRVRPRVQGDGTPVAWSSSFEFKTTPDARVQPMKTDFVLYENEDCIRDFFAQKPITQTDLIDPSCFYRIQDGE